MSSLDKIDSNTLIRIIHYAVGPKANTLYEWKDKLKYLHVCTLWADIVKPLVLTEGFIRLTPNRKRANIFSAEIPKTTVYETNVPIIIYHGYHHHVKSFIIRSARHIMFAALFRIVLGILQPDKYEWPSVSILEIRTIYEINERLLYYRNILTDDIADDFVERLYGCMPSVRHLEVHEHRTDSAFIANPLANRYMRQLVYLSTSGPIDFSMSHFCADLRWLEISLNPKSGNIIYLPQLRAAPLETLSLLKVPQQFSWAEFYDADGPNITFHSLKNLKLVFQCIEESPNGDKAWPTRLPPRFIYHRLHFPKLVKLGLGDCPSNSELFYCQPYFNDLELLAIMGFTDMIYSVRKMGFSNLKTLVIYLSEENEPDRETFYAATNYIFSKLKISHGAYFRNEIRIGYSDMQFIEWPFLTCIHLVSPICFSVYIRLMSILPNPTRSIASNLTTDEPTSYLNDIGPDDNYQLSEAGNGRTKPNAFKSLFLKLSTTKYKSSNLDDIVASKVTANVTPLASSKIRSLWLYFSKSEVSHSRIVVAICCIVACFPSLRTVHIDPKFKNIATHLVRLEPTFKWLSNIFIDPLEIDAMEARAQELFYFM